VLAFDLHDGVLNSLKLLEHFSTIFFFSVGGGVRGGFRKLPGGVISSIRCKSDGILGISVVEGKGLRSE